jgi:hypothetical protein
MTFEDKLWVTEQLREKWASVEELLSLINDYADTVRNAGTWQEQKKAADGISDLSGTLENATDSFRQVVLQENFK